MKQAPKYYDLRLEYRIWMENPDHAAVLDDGRWALLKAIRDHASIRKAGEALGISYRKAWGDLRKTEEFLGFALIEKHRGGPGGGATSLTAEGLRFVSVYEEFHKEFAEAVKPAIRKLKRTLKEMPL